MQTELPNPRTAAIDRAPTIEILRLMNDEDAAVPGVVRAALPAIAAAVDAIVAGIERGGRLIYVGAGTSGRLAAIDAAECVPTFNTDPGLVICLLAGGEGAMTRSVEAAEDDPDAGRAELLARGLTANDVVVGVAASGRTPYVLGAVEAARAAGAPTAGIACSAPSPLLEAVDIPIPAVTGPEVIAGSTRLKAGTAQKLILNMLTTASMIRLGKVYRNRMVDVRASNDKLVWRARRMIAELIGVDEGAAGELLDRAGGQVKTAIVVGLLGVSADEARARLAAAKGRLAAIIEENGNP